ncbi:ganglioside GM2 activator-like [Scyliorhinus torazame]|uniref:ganglioside GM2 activator-like n=1 Tax=Scyliorhinus torazame TaxID=75743 RepID=UPI003B58E6F2
MVLPLSITLLVIHLFHQIRTSNSLSWNVCNDNDSPIILNNFSIQPDPIKIPGTISIACSFYVNKSISLPKVEVAVQKKFLFWWKLPCINPKCTYDLCELLHLESSCVLNPGYLNFPQTTFDIPQSPLLSFWTAGEYNAKVHLKSNEVNVGCFDFYFNVET